MPRIDLTEASLTRLMSGKALTFKYVAHGLIGRSRVSSAVELIDSDGMVTARAYCLINTAYKHQFCKEPMLTDENKRAALQACAIMAVRPFLPIDPGAVAQWSDLYANQQFAFYAGAAVIRRPRLHASTMDRLRLYDWLSNVSFPSLKAYIDDMNQRRETPGSYDVELSDSEWHHIDTIMYRFEAMARER